MENNNININAIAREIEKEDVAFTIEELYIWAKARGYEKFSLTANDEGMPCNVIISNIIIDTNEKEIMI